MKKVIVASLSLLISTLAQADLESWGGKGIGLTIDGDTANLDFDCASAHVDHGFTFRRGVLKAKGTYTPASGIALPPGNGHQVEPATFSAVITNGLMRLTIVRTTIVNNKPREITARYELKNGAPAELMRCM